MNVQVSFQYTDFISCVCISRNGTAGLYINSTSNFWGILCIIFLTGWVSLHSHQWYIRLVPSTQPHKHLFPWFIVGCLFTLFGLFLFYLFDISYSHCNEMNTVIFIGIFLMISDVKHFFIHLFTLFKSSFEKCLFRSPKQIQYSTQSPQVSKWECFTISPIL